MPEKLNPEDVKARTIKVLKNSLLIELPDSSINLLGSGVLDSLSLVEFLVRLETEFNIKIGLEDMELDYFKTIESITIYIMNKNQESDK